MGRPMASVLSALTSCRLPIKITCPAPTTDAPSSSTVPSSLMRIEASGQDVIKLNFSGTLVPRRLETCLKLSPSSVHNPHICSSPLPTFIFTQHRSHPIFLNHRSHHNTTNHTHHYDGAHSPHRRNLRHAGQSGLRGRHLS